MSFNEIGAILGNLAHRFTAHIKKIYASGGCIREEKGFVRGHGQMGLLKAERAGS